MNYALLYAVFAMLGVVVLLKLIFLALDFSEWWQERNAEKKEKAWLKNLQGVLDECPTKGLGFYTTGDRAVAVYDAKKQTKIDAYCDANPYADYCSAVDNCGAWEGSLSFPNDVHSTAG